MKTWKKLSNTVQQIIPFFHISKNLQKQNTKIPKHHQIEPRIYKQGEYAGVICLENGKEMVFDTEKDFLQALKSTFEAKESIGFTWRNLSEENAYFSKQVDDFFCYAIGVENNQVIDFYNKRSSVTEKMNRLDFIRLYTFPTSQELIWENKLSHKELTFPDWESVEEYINSHLIVHSHSNVDEKFELAQEIVAFLEKNDPNFRYEVGIQGRQNQEEYIKTVLKSIEKDGGMEYLEQISQLKLDYYQGFSVPISNKNLINSQSKDVKKELSPPNSVLEIGF